MTRQTNKHMKDVKRQKANKITTVRVVKKKDSCYELRAGWILLVCVPQNNPSPQQLSLHKSWLVELSWR